QLIGPPVGSLTFSMARWLPFAFDAVSFVASALLLVLVPHTAAGRPRTDGVWRALRRSTAYLLAHRDLRTLAFLTAAGNFSINMVMGILVLYATDPHGLGIPEANYGLLLVAMAVGGIAGGFLTPRVIGMLGARTTMIAGLTAEGGAWLIVAGTTEPIVAGAALALASVAVTLV